MKKNDEITAVVSGLGSNGEGIIKTDDTVIFVPFCLVGENVRVKILSVKGNIAYGKVLEVLTPADDRVRPVCPVFTKCGGCQLQHMKYSFQLSFKSKLVSDCLNKIGGISVSVPLCVKSDEQFGYRNKLQLPIGVDKEGKTVIGFYAERSHRIVPVRSCALHPDWANTIIDCLYRFMEKCGLDGYDEEKKTGHLRHIVVRNLGGKYIIVLVTAVKKISGIDYFLALLSEKFVNFTFYLNYNDKDTNVVMGDDFTLLHGEGFFEAEENGIKYVAGANTFVQVNENIRRKLYNKAVALATEGMKTVIDCYSGGGLMTAMLAKKCERAYGIEVVPEAVRCANELATLNGLEEKMINICGKVEEEIESLISKTGIEETAIILDPPRKGVERAVIEAIKRAKAERIVMISCNPATMARDVGLLTGSLTDSESGMKKTTPDGIYEIEYIQPFDMFPNTRHVETLVVLTKKK